MSIVLYIISDCFLAWRVASDDDTVNKVMTMCKCSPQSVEHSSSDDPSLGVLHKPSDAIAITAAQFLSILSSSHSSRSIPTFDAILGLLVRFPCNNFAIVDDLWSGIAAGVYPNAALFNHSCRRIVVVVEYVSIPIIIGHPNVIPAFGHGSTLSFRAIRDISPGEVRVY